MRFGPFTLRIQSTPNAFKWICRCPFHRDSGDKAGTHCTRATVYHNQEQKQAALLLLLAWALAGRACTSRANPKEGSHKDIQNKDLPREPMEVLEQRLNSALADAEWLLTAGQEDDASSSSSS